MQNSMARKLQTAFIALYIFQAFFCIFARIESWPFSDYQVFKDNSHPSWVKAYAPWLKLQSGRYFNPASKDIYYHIDRSFFHMSFIKMPPEDRETYLSRLAKSSKTRAFAAKMRARGLEPEALVPMEVSFKDRGGRKWEPVSRPLKEYALD